MNIQNVYLTHFTTWQTLNDAQGKIVYNLKHHTQSIQYQSKHNNLLRKIQFRATCLNSLLSHLQALKEQIQSFTVLWCILGSQNAP